MKQVTPLSGWLLARAVEIDLHYPGFCGHLHRCSSERRHVVAAYLAVPVPVRRFGSTFEVGEFLTQASHGDILGAAFGTVPSGFRRALGRSGEQPHGRRHYRYLYVLISGPHRPAVAQVIPHLPSVSPMRLRVARILPPDLCRPNLIMACKDVRVARDLTKLVGLLQEVGAERHSLMVGLKGIVTPTDIREWAKRAASRVLLPDHPVPAANGYIPILSGDDLKRMAIRHRNCSRNYLANVLEGRSAFALVSENEKEAVVHLVRVHGRWTLDDVFGRGNSAPEPVLVKKAKAHLGEHGIVMHSQRPQTRHRWDALRRIVGHFNYETGWEFE